MSRALGLLCLSVVVNLCACGGPMPGEPGIVYSPCAPVVLSPGADTTAAELESIVAAIGLWRNVGVTALTLTEVADAEHVPLRFKDAAAPFHGVYEPSSGVVFVNRDLSGRNRELTVAHEVGHALGLPHVALTERASVMNPANLTILPSDDDEGALRKRWSCPLAH